MMAGRLLMGGCRSAAGGLGARGPAVAGRRRHVSTAQVRAELRDHVIGQHAGRAQRRPTPGHSPTAAPAARRTYPSINQSVTKCHQQLHRYFTWSARRAAAAAINRYLLRVRARPQQQTRRRTQLLSIDGTDRRTDGHLTV